MISQVWLKTFCTLVEVGHFTKTADALFMTQSGVSQQIKKLEEQLGLSLIIREGKSFSLTEAGRILNVKGHELLKSAEELEALLKMDERYSGEVRLASPGSVGLKLYPYLLEVQEQHRELVIDYRFAPNKQIEQDLADRKIDLGLITAFSNEPAVISEKIADEPLVLVTSADVKTIDWQVLLDLGFIFHPDANHHGRLLLSQNFADFQHMEQLPRKGFSNQISLILEPVSRGIGFTVLPLYAAKAFNKQDDIKIHFLNQPVSESLYCCFNKHSTLPNRIRFIQTVLQQHLISP